ncbi:MAG: sulfotransferase [Chromatiales bacterium]|nr:sulfotransferase [Chromatiales bacterium]
MIGEVSYLNITIVVKPKNNMFVIFGNPRSGTTLLATTLSLHSKILVLDQTDFIVPWAMLAERVKDDVKRADLMISIALASRYYSASLGPYVAKEELKQIVFDSNGDFVTSLQNTFSKIKTKTGMHLVGDKSVSDISYFPILNRTGLLDGEIKIIHIVRDVRDVMISLERLNWVKDRRIFPRSWAHSNLGLNDLLKEKSYYKLIRYEDFVFSPSQNLRLLFDFLGVQRENVWNLPPEQRGLEYIGQAHHENLQKPISAERVFVWKNNLASEYINACAEQSKEALERFGYLDADHSFDAK